MGTSMRSGCGRGTSAESCAGEYRFRGVSAIITNVVVGISRKAINNALLAVC